MYTHHQATIEQTIAYFQTQPNVEALLLTGSIAHGLANADSDVDIAIVVSDAEFEGRAARQETVFFNTDLAVGQTGYVDGKYISAGFMEQVAARGSEPARFAFTDAQILFSHRDNLADQLAAIVRYPTEDKINRITGFHAQLEAWHWFTGEAEKKNNPYLMMTAISKLALFGGRMILAHNEMLYPYHKWLLAMLDKAPLKPDGLTDLMRLAGAQPTKAHADQFYALVKDYRAWEAAPNSLWSNRFMVDIELTWMVGNSVVDDM